MFGLVDSPANSNRSINKLQLNGDRVMGYNDCLLCDDAIVSTISLF